MRFFRIITSFITVSICLVTTASALERTLAELVASALRENPFLASARARVEEQRYSAKQARQWGNPSVDLTVGSKREASEQGVLYEVALAQPVPFLGKQKLRGDLLDITLAQRRIDQHTAEREVTLKVIRLGYEYAILRWKVGFVEKRQRRFELMRSYMTGRTFVSPQQKTEIQLVEHRLKRLASDGIQTQAALRASFEKLKALVFFESEPFPEIGIPWFSGTKRLDEKEWEGKTVAKNPDLAAQQLTVQSIDVEKRLASREAWPDVSLTAFYNEATADETERSVGGGLRFDLPAWNRNRAGIQSAEQKKTAEEELLRHQSRQLSAELRQLLAEYEGARKIAEQYPPLILAELEAQIQETEEEFKKGRVDLLTFLELDNEVAEIFNRVLDAQLTLVGKIVALFDLSAEPDPLAQLDSF